MKIKKGFAFVSLWVVAWTDPFSGHSSGQSSSDSSELPPPQSSADGTSSSDQVEHSLEQEQNESPIRPNSGNSSKTGAPGSGAPGDAFGTRNF